MKKSIVNFFTFSIIFIVLITSGFSNLEVFTKYDTQITLHENNTMDISKRVLLRNIHDVGIVPGEIQFKVNNPGGNEDFKIKSINVTNRYDDPIKHQVINIDGGYVVLLDIFTPVLPGSEYMININTSVEYNPTGFLFRNLEIPLKEISTIPISSGKVTLNIPKWNHLTYTSSDYETMTEGKSFVWNIDQSSPQSVRVEYSLIPLKIGNIKGSLVFWVVVNIILISLLVIHIRKAMHRNGANLKKKRRGRKS